MPDPFFPSWLDPRDPRYGSLDATIPKHAEFIVAIDLDPRVTQHPYNASEITTAYQTVIGVILRHIPPFKE